MSWNSYSEPLPSMLHAIGRTPLVRLRRIEPRGHELLAKVEWYGPTGSVKDRIYAFMLDRAERRGELRAGMTILECTTGNAGIACAAVAAIKGYPCVVIMPEGMGEERRKMIAAYGAELILTPGGESDIDVALARMEQMRKAQPGKYFVPAEFENPDNIEAHRLTTGPEIWEQTGGRLDAVVAAQGTGGWISGVARFLNERGSRARIYAVEPAECALISDGEWGPHGIAGIGDGIVPKNLDLSVIDGIVTVTTEASWEMARRLAREEGIFCGTSSGCNVAAALVVAAAHPELRRIVTVVPDTGQRYFSSGLFGEPPAGEIPEREHRFDPHTAAQLRRHRDRLELLGGRASQPLPA
jgi:cysteine synthase A